MGGLSDSTPTEQLPEDRARISWMGRVDHWMAQNPLHPRFVPLIVYVALLAGVGYARDWNPRTYPLLYTLQCGIVVWIILRYRKLLPEVNLRFHWPAAVIGLGCAAAWIGLGLWIAGLGGDQPDASKPESMMAEMGLYVGWTAMALRLLGMAIVVPIVEELFYRSVILRCCHRFKPTAVALVHLGQDLPGVGEAIDKTNLGSRADAYRRGVFGRMFLETPLGRLSVLSVTVSSLLWCLSHVSRDWLGTLVCGVGYAIVIWAANRRGKKRGLGPAIWAHGITNAALWGYTLLQNDWRFL